MTTMYERTNGLIGFNESEEGEASTPHRIGNILIAAAVLALALGIVSAITVPAAVAIFYSFSVLAALSHGLGFGVDL